MMFWSPTNDCRKIHCLLSDLTPYESLPLVQVQCQVYEPDTCRRLPYKLHHEIAWMALV